MYKQFANNQEKKEFRDIERKYNKKSSIAQRTVPFKPVSVDKVPLDFSGYENLRKINFEKNNTLKNIEQDRNKTDPDFYKGLGTFFLKKF